MEWKDDYCQEKLPNNSRFSLFSSVRLDALRYKKIWRDIGRRPSCQVNSGSDCYRSENRDCCRH